MPIYSFIATLRTRGYNAPLILATDRSDGHLNIFASFKYWPIPPSTFSRRRTLVLSFKVISGWYRGQSQPPTQAEPPTVPVVGPVPSLNGICPLLSST